jgi:hypothetical protein
MWDKSDFFSTLLVLRLALPLVSTRNVKHLPVLSKHPSSPGTAKQPLSDGRHLELPVRKVQLTPDNAGSLAASRTRSQVRPAQLAHQNWECGRCAKTKANAIRMPGKERPAAPRLVIQRPLTTKPHQKNLCRNKKPSAGQPISQTAEGLDYRFLRSQPRVIGPGSLRKARPRQSDSQLNTQPDALNIRTNSNGSNHALQRDAAAR